MMWVIQNVLGLFQGSWNYVASSGSSTTEGASDVSLSHLFHLSPSTCRLFCLGFVCVGLVWVLFCVFVWCFAGVGGFFDLYPRVLDDRQCFIARSAMRKKKQLHSAYLRLQSGGRPSKRAAGQQLQSDCLQSDCLRFFGLQTH